MSSKPIFIAKQYFENPEEVTRSMESIRSIQRNLQLQLNDYHVLFIPIVKNKETQNCDVIFESFYPNKLSEKDWEDFKTEVKNQLKQNLKTKEDA